MLNLNNSWNVIPKRSAVLKRGQFIFILNLKKVFTNRWYCVNQIYALR